MQGKIGPQGVQGKIGDQGVQGKIGETGAQGPTGADGPTGYGAGPTGDDGATGPTGPTGADGAVVARIVFTTIALNTGNLGGLEGADAICNQLADAAGLTGPYMAWLSDTTGSPSTRFDQSPGPYVRVDGVIVADDWDDLTDGSVDNLPNIDENGSVAGDFMWTGTNTDGTAQGGFTCSNWSTDVGTAFVGFNFVTDSRWTAAQNSNCEGGGGSRFYCFEQFTGTDGATGPTGAQGAQGKLGDTGSQGPVGPTGPSGPLGDQGAQGKARKYWAAGCAGQDGTARPAANTRYSEGIQYVNSGSWQQRVKNHKLSRRIQVHKWRMATRIRPQGRYTQGKRIPGSN